MGVPFLGEVPLNILLRESGDDGRLRDALAPGSPSRAATAVSRSNSLSPTVAVPCTSAMP